MKLGQYPDAFYRVSVKAVIKDSTGSVLVVQENKDWTLPGGGIDHGESPLVALKRELSEEVLIDTHFSAFFLGTESFYVESKNMMALWLLYEVIVADKEFNFGAGEDADDVRFRKPNDFKHSQSLFEQIIYRYAK
ncbi:NUDIX hydrolase [Candidatus Saccharibacteria bacterium]|nr:NUDIX hydrolase [Candidatus Saccharibacteria bacterium]